MSSSDNNDYLFKNYDSVITFDYTKLKMMLGELHKNQKKHSETLMEILTVIYNTEKEEQIFKRLGSLEHKKD
jgi:hypothetical protein